MECADFLFLKKSRFASVVLEKILVVGACKAERLISVFRAGILTNQWLIC